MKSRFWNKVILTVKMTSLWNGSSQKLALLNDIIIDYYEHGKVNDVDNRKPNSDVYISKQGHFSKQGHLKCYMKTGSSQNSFWFQIKYWIFVSLVIVPKIFNRTDPFEHLRTFPLKMVSFRSTRSGFLDQFLERNGNSQNFECVFNVFVIQIWSFTVLDWNDFDFISVYTNN